MGTIEEKKMARRNQDKSKAGSTQIPRELTDLQQCLNQILQQEECSVNAQMLKKAFNATNRMCFLYHERAELEELEHQQKCQIEGLRKHYKQRTDERDGLQATRAKNETHLNTLNTEYDEAFEYGETLDKNIVNLNADVKQLTEKKTEVEMKQAAEKKKIEDEKNITIAELEAELKVKQAENAKYKKAINAAKASVGGLTNALTACKDTLESAM